MRYFAKKDRKDVDKTMPAKMRRDVVTSARQGGHETVLLSGQGGREDKAVPVQTKRKKRLTLALVMVLALVALLVWQGGLPGNERSRAGFAGNAGGNLDDNVGDLSAGNVDGPNGDVSAGNVDGPNGDVSAGIMVAKTQCPIALPSSDALYYSRRSHLESWNTLSDMECRDFATELLIGLRDDGYQLVRSDLMDLSGRSWSCVVKSSDGEVYLATLKPQFIGTNRGAADRLNVTLLHFFDPGIVMGPQMQDSL